MVFVSETGMSDYHKLLKTISRQIFTKLRPKDVKYRSYKNFDANKLFYKTDEIAIQEYLSKKSSPYQKITDTSHDTKEKHALLKPKIIRVNQASFMKKGLRKAIKENSRLRNRNLRYPSMEKFLTFKKMKNKCNKFVKQSKKKYSKYISHTGRPTSKKFWKTVKLFIEKKENVTIRCRKK